MGFRSLLLALPLCLVGLDGAVAQTKDRLDRRDKLLGFEAVGRLESDSGFCTAALITNDVVLTAAHCVFEAGSNFTFRAGYRDGTSVATRDIADVVIAKGYTDAMAKGDRAAAIANDVALVRLSSPIHENGTDPYEIAQTPRKGAALTLASYGRGRMEALTLERGCALDTFYPGGIVGIDCDATFGSSGAPVFIQVGGRTRIFSLVSSGSTAADGSKQTLGVGLTTLVPELLVTLRKSGDQALVSTGARRIVVGERTSTGGARFVRP